MSPAAESSRLHATGTPAWVAEPDEPDLREHKEVNNVLSMTVHIRFAAR